MRLEELENTVLAHSGQFLCERIHDKANTKLVRFTHVVGSPDAQIEVPAVGGLRDFYDTFGSILFYYDETSGDAAKYLAHPSEWADLQDAFSNWIQDLNETERRKCLPAWIDACLVIGETPQSGNYILVPTEGPEAGQVFEFDHDGFEFIHKAKDLVAYVEKLLKPDNSMLIDIATHMRFIEGDPMVQWWIRELRDKQGKLVATTETGT